METKTLSKIAPTGFFVGMAIIFSGLGYSAINYPSRTPALERHYKIERELDKIPQIRLGDLELKSTEELISYADELKTERNEIVHSNMDFVEVSRRYESEMKNAREIRIYGTLGGGGLMLLGIISGFISSMRESSRKGRNNLEGYTKV